MKLRRTGKRPSARTAIRHDMKRTMHRFVQNDLAAFIVMVRHFMSVEFRM